MRWVVLPVIRDDEQAASLYDLRARQELLTSLPASRTVMSDKTRNAILQAAR